MTTLYIQVCLLPVYMKNPNPMSPIHCPTLLCTSYSIYASERKWYIIIPPNTIDPKHHFSSQKSPNDK